MHQSIPVVPIPPPPQPGQPRGICSRCQSRGWGTRNFSAAPGAFVKDWLVHQGLEKLVAVFKGMFSQC